MILGLLMLACEPPEPPQEDLCADVSAEKGHLVCLHRIDGRADWDQLAKEARPIDQNSSVKWMMPADHPDARLPLFYGNSQIYDLHSSLLQDAFRDIHPGVDQLTYSRWVLDHPRVYFSGNISEYVSADGSPFMGFIVWDDPADADKTVTYEEVLTVWKALSKSTELGPLTFVPNSANQRDASESWEAPFAIRGLEDLPYEVYSPGEAYGTLRLQPLDELEDAQEDAAFGWQDILVFDEAPVDLERVVSGIVTGSRQGELSHLNVRSAARGTPNCYVRAPFDALAEYDGQLVRFECGDEDWSVELADPEDAEAWWEALRPEPVAIPAADTTERRLLDLLDPDARQVAAYGSKGANLATLYSLIDPSLTLQGLVVPMAYFADHVEGLDTQVDPNDAALRREQLEALRDAIREREPDPALVLALYDAIVEVEGSDTVMVRFRSSSNAEDALEFSGAGLYDSTSVCPADSFDDDDEGPSLCDPDQPKERTIERGLTKVWASLYNPGAWDERAWYGVDEDAIAMGILVNTRSKDEQANVVAFTGVPSDPDDGRFLVNAQVGHLDVVSAEAGVWPERTLLEMDAGQVVDIVHAQDSSEGVVVLDDEQLDQLGEALWTVREVYPSVGEAMLDTEWKVLGDGRLVIKQIRPF